MDINKIECRFKMNHPKKGTAVIFNNTKFNHASPRPFSDYDCANLYKVLSGFGFNIRMYTNRTAEEICQAMVNEAKANHGDADCFLCVFLSYGDYGVIEAADRPVQTDNVIEYFKGNNCPSLAGKPKIFIFQACNPMVYHFTSEQTDGDNMHEISAEADFLLVWSLVPGEVSWRDSTRGSCFVDHLCCVLTQYGKSVELSKCFTIVNRRVSEELESKAPEAFKKCARRLPCIINMLTKEIYF